MAFVPDQAIDRSHEIPGAAFRLYCYYCKRRDAETGLCWPSLKLCAQELQTAYTYTSEMRAKLIAAGWIEMTAQGQIRCLMGFGNSETGSEKPKLVSEFPNKSSEKPNNNSEKPKPSFGKTEDSFGNSELHIGITSPINQPIEPAQLTSPIGGEENNMSNLRSTAVTPSPPDHRAGEVQEIFAYWQASLSHPTAKLTAERRRKVEARLRQGYTVEQIKQAIDGCAASPFHRGENDEGRVYDDLELICRSGSKLENFIARLSGGANGRGKCGVLGISTLEISDNVQATIAAGERLLRRKGIIE